MAFTFDDTDFSRETDDDVGPGVERRGATRHATVLQIAKLSTDSCEELCILRDISSTGLRAESYYPLSVGARVSLELKTGRRVTGHVVWSDGSAFGVEFDVKVPVFAILAHQTLDELGRRVRQPRLRANTEASLFLGEEEIAVRLSDVSQAGLRIGVGRLLRIGARVEIALQGLGRRKAIVRWYRDGEAGVMFVQPMTYPEFAAWRQTLARFGAGGGDRLQ